MANPSDERRGGRHASGRAALRLALRGSRGEIEAALARLLAGTALEVALEWAEPGEGPTGAGEPPAERRSAGPRRYVRRLPVRRPGGVTRFVEVDRIDWIQAANQYARLHTGDGKFLVRESLSSLQDRLDPERFRRIHRSAVVNLERVRELWTESPTVRWAVLDGGTRLPVSRGHWDDLQTALVGTG